MEDYKTAYLIIRFDNYRKLKDIYEHVPVVLKPDIGDKGVMFHSHDFSERDPKLLDDLFNLNNNGYGNTSYYEVKYLIPERYYNRERLTKEEQIFSKKYSCMLPDNRTEFQMAWLT